jgi:hypothetical protein
MFLDAWSVFLVIRVGALVFRVPNSSLGLLVSKEASIVVGEALALIIGIGKYLNPVAPHAWYGNSTINDYLVEHMTKQNYGKNTMTQCYKLSAKVRSERKLFKRSSSSPAASSSSALLSSSISTRSSSRLIPMPPFPAASPSMTSRTPV